MSTNRSIHALGYTACGLVLLLLAVGCDALNFAPLVSATTTLTEEFKTGPSPKIVIETFNGSIDVSEGESDEVVVEVTKRAGGFDRETAEANLDYIEVSIVQKDDTIHVTARRLGRQGNFGAAVVVAAPKAARLNLKSSNGRVVCEGLEGGIEATTSNGKIEIVEARGAIDVATSNGGIEIEADDATVEAKSSNGTIKFQGTLADKEHRFKTSNGRIQLYLPAKSQFRLDCSTSNASVQCDFPIAEKARSSKRKLAGTVGDDPRFSIVAQTSNGGISIRKADADKPIRTRIDQRLD